MSDLTDRPTFQRAHAAVLATRLAEPRRFLHVVAGPRQVGKTTLVQQVLAQLDRPTVFVSADEPALRDEAWLAAQWERARLLAKDSGKQGAVLALDEVQKVPDWSETVKRLWDEDIRHRQTLLLALWANIKFSALGRRLVAADGANGALRSLAVHFPGRRRCPRGT